MLARNLKTESIIGGAIPFAKLYISVMRTCKFFDELHVRFFLSISVKILYWFRFCMLGSEPFRVLYQLSYLTVLSRTSKLADSN